jgi:hypothetical protein
MGGVRGRGMDMNMDMDMDAEAAVTWTQMPPWTESVHGYVSTVQYTLISKDRFIEMDMDMGMGMGMGMSMSPDTDPDPDADAGRRKYGHRHGQLYETTYKKIRELIALS